MERNWWKVASLVLLGGCATTSPAVVMTAPAGSAAVACAAKVLGERGYDVLSDSFIARLNLNNTTMVLAFVALCFSIMHSYLSGESFMPSFLAILIRSAEFFAEGLFLYFIFHTVLHDFDPKSAHHKKITLLRSISYVVASGIIISALYVLIEPGSSVALNWMMFIFIVFIRYVLLMVYFDIMSFMHFSIIAIFFSATSWAFTKAIAILKAAAFS